MTLKFLKKIFNTQGFFTDQLKLKTVNKTLCRTPSGNPCQPSSY